eukprot:CAMPEP_0170606328 /NCGR_PEP_ID=MMETSP0224-20130122/20455_1 /TAXON_ID=285029 /ORGANISM="Togula jolla, Strain CCCM 725" /LENGTH=63 /DNA_ID=CAMNT_0010931405 /DNA_START=76 /DNA_END=267 /DNA_ORIENTATION=+
MRISMALREVGTSEAPPDLCEVGPCLGVDTEPRPRSTAYKIQGKAQWPGVESYRREEGLVEHW